MRQILQGTLANVPAAELGSIVIKEALNRANVKPEHTIINDSFDPDLFPYLFTGRSNSDLPGSLNAYIHCNTLYL